MRDCECAYPGASEKSLVAALSKGLKLVRPLAQPLFVPVHEISANPFRSHRPITSPRFHSFRMRLEAPGIRKLSLPDELNDNHQLILQIFGIISTTNKMLRLQVQICIVRSGSPLQKCQSPTSTYINVYRTLGGDVF